MSSRTTPFVAVGAAVLWATASATAQTPSTGEPRNLSIPAEPLANALNDLAEQSGLQVMFASELVARLKSPEVRGSLTAAEALQRLLGNTGLRFEFVNPHTIAIMGPERKHSNIRFDSCARTFARPRPFHHAKRRSARQSRRQNASQKLLRTTAGSIRRVRRGASRGNRLRAGCRGDRRRRQHHPRYRRGHRAQAR